MSALMCVAQNGFATVCAWCPDKATVDQRCEAEGYRISHGICPDCQRKQLQDVTPESFPVGFIGTAALAEICGISQAALENRHRPGRWREGYEVQVCAHGRAYREAFLGELVGELAVSGQRDAAARLLSWLSRDAAPHDFASAGERVAPPSPRRSWLNQWEDQNT